MTAPRTSADDLADADRALDNAAERVHHVDTAPAVALALVGIGRAMTAIARRHDETCREIVAVLTSARRGDAP
ncbi:hypothetical protein AB0425_17380 [Actinosynnema sp. NPDC051121]